MGKVDGSLAGAGKVRGHSPMGTFVLYFCGSRGGLLYRNSHANFVGERSPLVYAVKIGARKCALKEVSRRWMRSLQHVNRSRVHVCVYLLSLFPLSAHPCSLIMSCDSHNFLFLSRTAQ